VSREDIIARSIEHFRRADVEFGRRIEESVAARLGASMNLSASAARQETLV
jgi:hypothetical protein